MRYLLITCIFLCNLSGIAAAGSDKDQVLKMLEGRHWKLDIRAFNKLGDDADIILIEIAENDSLMNVLRFRALEVLSLFPTDKTAAFLEDTAEKAFTPRARRGFETMKRSFAKTKPERVKRLATKLLITEMRIYVFLLHDSSVPWIKLYTKTLLIQRRKAG